MAKRTATSVARSLGISPDELIKHAHELGHEIKSAKAPLDEKVANDLSVKVAMKLAGVPVGATIIRTPKKRVIKKAKKKPAEKVKKKAAKKVAKKKAPAKKAKGAEEKAAAPAKKAAKKKAAKKVRKKITKRVTVEEAPPEEAAPAEVAAEPLVEAPEAAAAPVAPEEAAQADTEARAAEAPAEQRKAPIVRADGLGPDGEAVVVKWPEKPPEPQAKKGGVEKKALESLAAELGAGPPEAPPRVVRKKVVKKIIRKVVRRRPTWQQRPTAPPAEKPKEAPPKKREPEVTHVKIEKLPSVQEYARMVRKSLDVLRAVLDDLGVDAFPDAELDEDTVLILGQELGIETEMALPEPEPEQLEARPPVVTVMGHVDHGKTSILDAIRHTQIVAGESGGITQHIGASKVVFNDQVITFIDTPGHEAFTAMRQRGANTTDLVVLVVAADDGVMPQTVEAINHAKNAEVPILVAVNKCDLPAADPDRAKRELAERGLTPEDWGGETIMCTVSAVTKEGLDHLLEMILLQSEMLELRANPNRRADGTVIESQLDPGRGAVASVIVQRGTLHVGDFVVSDEYFGKVRALTDDRGRSVEAAAPSIPVEILGLNGVPPAGSAFRVMKTERQARRAAEAASAGKAAPPPERPRPTTLEELFGMQAASDKKELTVLIKADVQGSVEALAKNLESLSTDKVSLSVLHSNVGDVNVSDVMLAAASDATIIAFRVKADADAQDAAKRDGVPMFLFEVIYKAIDSIRQAMENLLEPEIRQVDLGQVEVREVFESSSFGMIAGCYVRDGLVRRNAKAELRRGDEVLWAGDIASLRRFKDEVREVQTGYECGMRLDGWGDIEVGDTIRIYTHEKIAQTL